MQRGEKLSGRSVPNGKHRRFGKPMLLMGCAGLFAAVIGLAMAMYFERSVKAEAGSDKVWKVTGGTVQERQPGNNGIPAHSLIWRLDEAALQRVLDQALPEGEGAMEKSPAVLSLPLPDGNVARFRMVDSPVLAPELAAQYPRIKSYRGQGVGNPSLTMRCSWTPSGLSALLTNGTQTVMIQPLAWFRQGPPQRDSSNQASPNNPNNPNSPNNPNNPNSSNNPNNPNNNNTGSGEVE